MHQPMSPNTRSGGEASAKQCNFLNVLVSVLKWVAGPVRSSKRPPNPISSSRAIFGSWSADCPSLRSENRHRRYLDLWGSYIEDASLDSCFSYLDLLRCCILSSCISRMRTILILKSLAFSHQVEFHVESRQQRRAGDWCIGDKNTQQGKYCTEHH